MKISAVVTVFNGERYLAAALESVFAQTRRPDEILVIDDGSSDGSLDLIRRLDPAIRIVSHGRNRGIAAARNSGIAEAEGDIIAFLDQDDLWHPEKTARQAEILEAEPGVAGVFSHAINFISPDLPAADRARLRCPETPLAHWVTPGGLIRRETFEQVGPFEDRFAAAPCMDWALRMKESGLRLHLLDAVHYRRRIHTTNHNFVQKNNQGQRLQIIKAALDRRRAEAAAAQKKNAPDEA